MFDCYAGRFQLPARVGWPYVDYHEHTQLRASSLFRQGINSERCNSMFGHQWLDLPRLALLVMKGCCLLKRSSYGIFASAYTSMAPSRTRLAYPPLDSLSGHRTHRNNRVHLSKEHDKKAHGYLRLLVQHGG